MQEWMLARSHSMHGLAAWFGCLGACSATYLLNPSHVGAPLSPPYHPLPAPRPPALRPAPRSLPPLQPKGQHFERRPLLPIPTRPASGLEPAPYLAAPAFSTCTVPIVFYPIFPDNFAHFFHGGLMRVCQLRPRWADDVAI